MIFKHLVAKFYWKAQYLLEVELPLLKQHMASKVASPLGIVGNLGYENHYFRPFPSV